MDALHRSFFRTCVAPILSLVACSLPAADPPPWASASGSDAHGVWADLTVNGVTQRMRQLPAGRFLMGSEAGDVDQKPVRSVAITLPFWLADTETTQELWIAAMGENPSDRTIERTGIARLPVENASYDDCHRFIAALNAKFPDLRACLPTEAQWEYACRSGGEAVMPADLDAVAWVQINSEGETQPVGTRRPNAWGLYDMLGNVDELCQDWYGMYFRDFPNGDERDPRGPAEGVWRSIRGGYYGSVPPWLGPTVRGTAVPTMGRASTGMRLAIAGRGILE